MLKIFTSTWYGKAVFQIWWRSVHISHQNLIHRCQNAYFLFIPGYELKVCMLGHRTLDIRHQTSDIGHASGFIFCPMLLYIALDRQQVFVIRHLFLGYRGLSRPASVFSMMMMMMMMTLHYGFRFRVPVSEFVFRILWFVTSLFQVSVLLSGSTFIHFVVLLLLPVCNLACLSLYYCGGYSFIRV